MPIGWEMSEWLTVKQLARHLQLSEAKIYAMARAHELPASRVGSQWRFDQAEIDEWLRRQHRAENTHGEAGPVGDE